MKERRLSFNVLWNNDKERDDSGFTLNREYLVVEIETCDLFSTLYYELMVL